MKRYISHSVGCGHPERSESTAQRSIRGVEGSLPPSRPLRTKLFRIGAIALAILREIFDESAYTRFLSRHRLPASCDSYAAFCRENGQARANRPRCC